MNRAEQKKKAERIILEKFIRAYKEKIDSNSSFEVLTKEAIRINYPNYNDENPDFVLLFNDNYIAIDVFELIRENLELLNKNPKEKELNIRNAAHLYSLRQKKNLHSLYLMEDIVSAALDRINDKIENKLSNYIDCPIWLIGYASKTYNLFLLSPYFEDKIELEIASEISNGIIKSDRVTSIWLTEFSSQDLLIKIK